MSGAVDIVLNVAGISVCGAVEDLEHRHCRKAIEAELAQYGEFEEFRAP